MTTVRFTRSAHPSPIGSLHIITNGIKLISLDFDGYEERLTTLLRRRFPAAELTHGATPSIIAAALDAYFDGDLAAFDGIAVEAGGSIFQQKVWAALRAIPAGETRGYGALAASLGQPTASRAVGLANGSNPIAIVVPCHRVIGANGDLTGYAGGLERKRFLLAHERGHQAAAA